MGLIAETRARIAAQLARAEKPAVACSFGKDSMVLLALVREQMPRIPVMYCEGFPHPTKHDFVKRMAKEWDLDLVMPGPIAMDIIAKGQDVSLMRIYELAPERIVALPVEAHPGYVPDASSQCALAAIFTPPPVVSHLNHDALFIGHRGDDVDPHFGAIPLADYEATAEEFSFFYPLRDWTEADIWRASDILGIPQNLARYERQDMDANNDYYPLCTECLKPSESQEAFCPQLGRDVPNRGNEMDLYGRREAWGRSFVNIDRRESIRTETV
jgi:3'-phosphoadenosine 5'-phosphosulfate sulfotransferase (PAPS reductase)/FAD synthetase